MGQDIKTGLNGQMKSHSQVVLGRFIELDTKPVVFVSKDACDAHQMAFLLKLTGHEGAKSPGVQTVPLAPNSGSRVRLMEVAVPTFGGIVHQSGFVIALNHLKLQSQALVYGYIAASRGLRAEEGLFNVGLDAEGQMQSWAYATQKKPRDAAA